MEEQTKKPKREPVGARMNEEVLALARNLARDIYGSEEKLGDFLEEAVQFYSAHHTDEGKAAALLKTTEEILFSRITNQFESMSRDLQKKIVERIAGLQAVSSFETTLTELMLKDITVRNEKNKARYEELRSTAATRMKDRMYKAGAEHIGELGEEIDELKVQVEKLQNELKARDKAISEYAGKLDTLKNYYNKLDEEKQRLTKTVESYHNLMLWYKRRDAEAPKLQEQNKGFMGKIPTYEEVNSQYEIQNPRPDLVKHV